MVEAADGVGGGHTGGRSRHPGGTEGGGLLPPRAWQGKDDQEGSTKQNS